MEWLVRMNRAIDYIEENLTENIELEDVAKIACCSSYHFQRMFSFIIDIPLAVYIRRRKLSAAAIELQNSDMKIIDIALKYGYDSPNSFTRAFKNLHGITPSEARKSGCDLMCYPVISFQISIRGDVAMQYRFEEREAFEVYGVVRRIENDEDQHEVIPKFWQKFQENGDYEKICKICGIEPYKELAIAGAIYDFDNDGEYMSKYMLYTERAKKTKLVEPFETLEIPKAKWVVFTDKFEDQNVSTQVIQNLWKRIFTEWFPSSELEMTNGPQLEVYPTWDSVEVWIPVKEKVK